MGIPQAAKRASDYPHQFSGGMRQRAMIAMALALNPQLIIADEPTTALDATIQAQILDLLLRMQREYDTALIMITHDLGVIADLADDVVVMYAGKVAEVTDRRTLLSAAPPVHPGPARIHPRQRGSHGAAAADRRSAAEPHQRAVRLRFPPALRVRHGPVHRSETPPLVTVAGEGGGHRSACWLPPQAAGLGADAEALRQAGGGGEPDRACAAIVEASARGPYERERRMTDVTALGGRQAAGGDVLLRIDNVVKYYPVRVGVLVKREVAARAGGRRREPGSPARRDPRAGR